MLIKFGLLQTEYKAKVKYRKGIEVSYDEVKGKVETIIELPEYIPGDCCDLKCPRVVKHGEECFIDTWATNGALFCDQCGKCLRYARKAAQIRGESPEEIKNAM